MLHIHTQSAYLNKKWKRIQRLIKKYCRNQDKDTLHKLRVALKQARAFINLLMLVHDKKYKKHFGYLKKIFKQAGRIRSAQLSLEIAGRLKLDNEDFSKGQVAMVKEQTAEFCAGGDKYIRHIKACGHFFDAELQPVKDKEIVLLYKNNLGTITRFFNLHDNAHLHPVRKKIKWLLYVHDMLPLRLKDKTGMNRHYLGKLEEAIGKWHDNIDNMALLRQKHTGATKQAAGKLAKENEKVLLKIKQAGTDFQEKRKTK